MAIRSIRGKNLTWHYLTDFDQAELKFLKDNFKFHPLDLKDCSGEVQRSKIDIYRNYIFLVLQLPEHSFEDDRVTITQFYVFLGKDYLVVVTKAKLKFLNNLFFRVANNQSLKENIFNQGVEYLLYQILDDVLRQRWKTLGDIDQAIKKIEIDIGEGRGKKVVYKIATMRRLLIQFKTILDPQKLTVNALTRLDVKFIRKDMAVYFDDIDDYIEKVWFSLQSYRDRILSLHEINESLISYRTNKILTLLTLFSVALLPLTVLSGIYGMNIDLPFSNSPGLVWLGFVVLALANVIIFAILKRKDWI